MKTLITLFNLFFPYLLMLPANGTIFPANETAGKWDDTLVAYSYQLVLILTSDTTHVTVSRVAVKGPYGAGSYAWRCHKLQ
jgi:hypothetical protein